jgi:hypothetical protein
MQSRGQEKYYGDKGMPKFRGADPQKVKIGHKPSKHDDDHKKKKKPRAVEEKPIYWREVEFIESPKQEGLEENKDQPESEQINTD